MNISFKEFLNLIEMGHHLTEPTEDINLQVGTNRAAAKFVIDGERYALHFDKHYSDFTDKNYSISLYGPNDVSLTGYGRGPTVYSYVIKAIRKFLESVPVEGLSFYGANRSQDLMYNTFYEKYLKKEFVRVDVEEYLSRALIDSFKESNPTVYQNIIRHIEETEQRMQSKLRRWKDEKAATRANTLKKMQQNSTSIKVKEILRHFFPNTLFSSGENVWNSTARDLVNGQPFMMTVTYYPPDYGNGTSFVAIYGNIDAGEVPKKVEDFVKEIAKLGVCIEKNNHLTPEYLTSIGLVASPAGHLHCAGGTV